MSDYKLQTFNRYRYMITNTSYRLKLAAWCQYMANTRLGAYDNPQCDNDVLENIEEIISEKVNNPRSKFYIYG